MAANYTEHYELNQWEPADQVLRTDFNADNAKLDAALAQKAERSELEATINTLRQIRQNPKATPGEKLEAIKLLMKLEGGVYG